MTEPLRPGQTIGVLGGGQLGRMLAMAAARLGFHVHVYEPGARAPASEVAELTFTAGYDDVDALERFAAGVDVVTYEFENVPAEALDRIEAFVPIRPNRQALSVSQDRMDEKTFLSEIGLAVAPFSAVNPAAADAAGELALALARVGVPAILKTRRLGYDGKGQARISSHVDGPAALDVMQGAPAILEGLVEFRREISVIAARGTDEDIVCFEPGENVHRNGILHTTTVPAAIDDDTRAEAFAIARTILVALDYVGVMGVELFETEAGLVVNEIAPRVHNSGHWTEAGAVIDQFEQHIRAVAGWPLVDPMRHSDVVMTNLIGDDVNAIAEMAGEVGARLHLYGKVEARPGRKMGHVTRVTGPARDR